MANLISTMHAAVTALDALQKAATATQNNVTNASTPGYAKQRAVLASLPCDPEQQLAGGVRLTGLVSSRDEFVEQSVRRQTSDLGAAEKLAQQRASLESSFRVGDTAGVAARVTAFFNAANAWSVAPQGVSEKSAVITAAQNVAEAFGTAARSLADSRAAADSQIGSTLSQIGDIAERIRLYNHEVRSGNVPEAGSGVYADLEQLSELADIQAVWQKDGTVTVLAGGQTALVNGDQRFGLRVAYDSTPPAAGMAGGISRLELLDENGTDVTATIGSGQLGGLLRFRNNDLPQLAGSMTAPGDLNRLAAAFADRVNQIVTSGDATAPAMFTYTGPGSAAQSLTVAPAMTSALLSAADPTTTPPVVNGRALALAALAHPVQTQDELDGVSYVSYFGGVAASVGRLSAQASDSVELHGQLRSQALSAREEISGVSLDEEAVSLLSVQRGYEATARMITTLDELMKLAVNTGRN